MVTMRLILPLDVSYAILFFTYVAFGAYLRGMKTQISPLLFFTAYDLNNCLLMIHSLASCLFYWRFTNDNNKKD
uniref:Uncharacterized protein n=1 Tax=Ditylenchus dipsaci TaxID=166011 RepID=A0A915EA60_9BILA